MSARPLFHWRMAAKRARHEADPNSWIHANREMLDWLRAELAEKGPLPASKIDHDANKRKGTWWEWSDVKLGLEYLFDWGEVVSAGRTRFERTYALAEHWVPAEVRDAEVTEADAVRTLLGWSARAHGVGTLGDLADYYRIKQAPARAAVADLVDAAALLSPFDPIVWARPRAERLFDFHYRIEIYTPAAQRIFGYYSLPVLVGDTLVGRVDLKNDRQNGVLRVQSAWREAGAPLGIEQRIVPLLESARAWQGLDRIEVVDRGDLAGDLAGALAAGGLATACVRDRAAARPLRDVTAC